MMASMGLARTKFCNSLANSPVLFLTGSMRKQLLDVSGELGQVVKSQNLFKGELSHGIVAKDVHQGVQVSRCAAAVAVVSIGEAEQVLAALV